MIHTECGSIWVLVVLYLQTISTNKKIKDFSVESINSAHIRLFQSLLFSMTLMFPKKNRIVALNTLLLRVSSDKSIRQMNEIQIDTLDSRTRAPTTSVCKILTLQGNIFTTNPSVIQH